VKHTPDQDLLLLAHRSLDPVHAFTIRLHVSRCDSCRKRLAEFTSISTAAASALRVGMPAWKPMGMALKMKLLLGGLLLSALLVTGGLSMAAKPHVVPPDKTNFIIISCEPKDAKNNAQHHGPQAQAIGQTK